MSGKKGISIWFVLLLMPLWLSYDAGAQSYTADVQRISVEDGLSNRFVTFVFQDSEGFMWIGTQHGLNRYDGYEFRTFTAENSKLGFNRVKSIHEDDQQRLWITFFASEAISILDLNTFDIQSFDDLFGGFSFDRTELVDTRSDDSGGIIFVSKQGRIDRYSDGNIKPVYDFKHEDTQVLQADGRFMWVRRPGKDLSRLTYEGQITTSYPMEGKGIVEVENGSSEVFWLLTRDFEPNQSVYSINQKGEFKKSGSFVDAYGDFSQVSISKLKVMSVTPEGDLVVLFTENNKQHMVMTDPLEGMVIDLQTQLDRYWSYGFPGIMETYFGRDGRMWLATEDGLVSIRLKKSKFNTVLDQSGGKTSRGIVMDEQGNTYINAAGGRYKVDVNGNILSIPGTYALGAAKDKKGNLWFSKHDNGFIEKYDPLLDKSTHYSSPLPVGEKPWSQWVIFPDKNGKVWTGSGFGLAFIEPGTDYVQNYEQYNSWPEIGEDYVYHITQADNGLWFSTAIGLYRLDYDLGVVERYHMDELSPRKIPHNEILHYHVDKDGVFWFATKGGGLVRFNMQTGDYAQFTEQDGLSNNTIYAVYEDDFDQLWLPSNNGLMRFDKESHEVITFLVGDGIAHNEFNTSSHYKDENGLLYFGGLKGVTIVDPKDFVKGVPGQDAPLKITSVQLLNGSTGALVDRTFELFTAGELVLTPSDKSLVIEFALLNYESNYQNNYAYKINGLDNDWNYIRSNNLRLNSLDYGTYTLQIKGRGASGKWSVSDLSVKLIVLRPLYMQTWFQLLLITLGGIILLAAFKWRIEKLKRDRLHLQQLVNDRTQTVTSQLRQIEEQANRLEALDQAKSRFFANISHELRTPLTLILGYIGNVLNRKDEVTLGEIRSGLSISRQNGQRLLTLTEEILDLSKLESGQLNLAEKPVAFYPFIQCLLDAYRSYVGQKDIDVSLHFGLPTDIVLNIDEGMLGKIINNLLSNAVKFTDSDGEVRLEVQMENENRGKGMTELAVKVIDDGRGIHPEDLPHVFDRFYQSEQASSPIEGGAGIGLSLVKELTELMGGSISVKSDYGKGSEFTLTIPVLVTSLGQSKPQPDLNGQLIKTTSPTTEKSQKNGALGLKPTVLLVEDHPQMRAYSKEVLGRNYNVVEAVDGLRALQVLKKQKVDLVVSDVMMPELDGFGLLQKIREEKSWEGLPVMMLTARASGGDKLAAFRIGVDDYLTKPYEADELLARTRNLLGRQQRRKRYVADASHAQEENSLSAFDQEFVKRAEAIVKQEIGNPSFGIIGMAEALAVSQRQLTRKMQQTTGFSPLQFIREIKLQTARQLLESREKETVAEVMYAIGMQSTGYFAKIYFKRFGKHPSAYFTRHST